jgi:PAS domain S-box-containing protein
MEPKAEPAPPRGSLRWWPTAFLVLLLLTFGGIYSLSALGRANALVKHTDEVRVALRDLVSTLSDAESGVRGYAVTGEPAFLDTYDRAQSTWRSKFDRVRVLTSDNPRQQERLDRLGAVLRERLSLLAELRSARQAGHQESELTPSMTAGKKTMDRIHALVDEMDGEEIRLGDTRQRETLNQWRLTMFLFIGGSFASWLVVFAVSVRRREVEVQRAHAEEVSRASELFRIVLEGTDLGITVQDRGGRVVFANDAAAHLIGFASPTEVLAAAPAEIMARFEILTFDGAPYPAEQLPGRTALQGIVTEEIRLRFKIRGKMEERWSVVRAVPALDSAGNVTHAINFFRDVTEEMYDKQQRAFLLRAVDEMTSSLDYERTLATVARLAVPVLGDWCAVDLVDGPARKRLATAHVDPTKLKFVAELERRYPPDPNSRRGVPEILRTGKAEFMPNIPRQLLTDAAVDSEHLRLIDELQLGSYVGVPLKVRGQVIGAFTIAMAESGRHHTERDLQLAQALADRAALAIDNARLFRELEKTSVLATAQRDQSEERFRLMVESIKDYAVFMLDPTGVITTWNAGAQLIKGYLPSEIIGQHFSRFYSEAEVRDGKCERELATATREGRFEEEGWRVRKDGSRFWASVVITAVRDARGQLKGFAKVTRDLTERRRSEHELAAEARRRLEAENQRHFAEMFVGILGHDLRNPLNSISMAATLITRKGSADPQALERILLSTRRMSNMVGQLLDLTRSRLAGGIPIHTRPTDLRTVVGAVIEELALVHRDRDIRFEKAGEINGLWDVDRLAQVVSNLVGNALEHGDASKPTTVHLSAVEDTVRLTVHSFGPPISSDLLAVIFDPYRRRNAARSERSRGLGLGLFIAEQIVVAHGGTIDCKSTEGDGTVFTVILPRGIDEKASSRLVTLLS